MNKYLLILLLLTLITSSQLCAQSYEVGDSIPPTRHGVNDGQNWRPIRPVPFKGCSLVINCIDRKIGIETVLKNNGFKSTFKVKDSTVVLTIDPVAENVSARSKAPVSLPYRFDLYVVIGQSDSAHYWIEYFRDQDSLSVKPDSTMKSDLIIIEPMNRISGQLNWILFREAKLSLLKDIAKEFEGVASSQVLQNGHYWGLPFSVSVTRDRKSRFNKSPYGLVLFLKPTDEQFPSMWSELTQKYRLMGKIVAQGCVNPVTANTERSEK